jgi:hypothetical protein
MGLIQAYHVGDRVQLTEPCAGGYVGEPARVLQVKHDTQGNVLALDILLDACNATTRGTTVYLHEVEPARPSLV